MAVKDSGAAASPGNPGGIWDPSRSHLRVILRDLVTEAPLGLHPWEQHPERLTRLVVNVEMFALLAGSLRDEHPDGIVDYDHIRDALRSWPSRAHTPLLETLLDEVVTLCFRSKRVVACRVSIVKPDIFNEAAAAGVEVYLLRADHAPSAAAGDDH
jgi:dihydroneopterin aldolase